MKQTHSKDTIVLLLLALLTIIIGEGIFRFGGYWIFVFIFAGLRKNIYWWGLLLGVVVSLFTGSVLGLASLLIIAVQFVNSRIGTSIRNNVILVSLAAALCNYAADIILGTGWSPWEILGTFVLVLVVTFLGIFNEDLRLRRV